MYRIHNHLSIQIHFVNKGLVSDIVLTHIEIPQSVYSCDNLGSVIRCDICIIPIKSPQKEKLKYSDVHDNPREI